MFAANVLQNLSTRDAYLFNVYGRGPSIPIPFSTAHAAFIHQASLSPNSIAIEDLSIFPRRTLTYDEVSEKAAIVASQLRRKGVGVGSRVPIVARRSSELIIGILAILLAGAQYIPLDVDADFNSETLRHVLKECGGSQLVVCMRSTKKRLESLGLPNALFLLEDALQRTNRALSLVPEVPEPVVVDKKSGCYVVYEPVADRIPQGVDVTHETVANLICLEPSNLGLQPGVRIGSILPLHYHAAQWEILGGLANGATLVLRGSSLESCLVEVNTLICTSQLLSEYLPRDLPNLTCVATTGDYLTQETADEWAAEVDFYVYPASSELALVSTTHKHVSGTPLSLGRPGPNNTVYLLDEQMQPVGLGQTGHIWIGGKCVTKGFLGLPEVSARTLRYDKFIGENSLMHKLGKLGRWNDQGSLEDLGYPEIRSTARGSKVELDEVTASLLSCTGVQSALATVISGEVHAFVSPATCDAQMIQAQMYDSQPDYAVPARFHMVDEFPQTPGGGLDKRILQATALEDFEPLSEPKPIARTSLAEKVSSGTLQDEKTGHIDVEKFIMNSAKYQTDSSNQSSTWSLADGGSEAVDMLEDLPMKNQGKRARGLRYRVFIVYRRLFSLLFLCNFAIFLTTLAVPSIDRKWWSYLAFINLTLAIVIRQDHVINTLFTISSSVPRSWPLSVRKKAAKIFHLGGLHSGGASSAVFWFLAFTVDNAVNHTGGKASFVMSIIILILLFSMLIFAYPALRKKLHNHFEMTHRFAGWTSLLLIWIQTVLYVNGTRGDTTLHRAMAESPNIWMLVVITISIASSWVWMVKYTVVPEVLSNHALRLHFDYTTPIHGSAVRLSDRPLLEWHAFATVPETNFSDRRPKGFSVVISRAGDWTGKQIENPPNKIWVRGIPTFGVMRVNSLFNRTIMVATGSGIGPCLGYIQTPPKGVAFRVIWSTPSPEKSFGSEICNSIRKSDPSAIIHDTRTQGRPDLPKMCYNVAKNFNAEAVIIIANEKITKKVVYALESRGVAAYGAIWDS